MRTATILAVALLALCSVSVEAYNTFGYCGTSPFSNTFSGYSDHWLSSYPTQGSTFTLSCFQASTNGTNNRDIKFSIACAERDISYNGGGYGYPTRFMNLGVLDTWAFSGTKTFSCPIEGYFYLIASYKSNKGTVLDYQTTGSVTDISGKTQVAKAVHNTDF